MKKIHQWNFILTSSENHKYDHHIWRWCTEALWLCAALDQHTLSRLNSVVECAAVVRLVREIESPVHFCAGTAMSPVRVWEAGPEITQIEKVQREHLYIKKAFKVCSQRGQKTVAKELKCPNSVEAYHGALSRLRLGFESRSGRFFFFVWTTFVNKWHWCRSISILKSLCSFSYLAVNFNSYFSALFSALLHLNWIFR